MAWQFGKLCSYQVKIRVFEDVASCWWVLVTDVLEEHGASIFRTKKSTVLFLFDPENEDTVLARNFCNHVQVDML
jgi:hypothetical protein